jgi:hypothetical protein
MLCEVGQLCVGERAAALATVVPCRPETAPAAYFAAAWMVVVAVGCCGRGRGGGEGRGGRGAARDGRGGR